MSELADGFIVLPSGFGTMEDDGDRNLVSAGFPQQAHRDSQHQWFP